MNRQCATRTTPSARELYVCACEMCPCTFLVANRDRLTVLHWRYFPLLRILLDAHWTWCGVSNVVVGVKATAWCQPCIGSDLCALCACCWKRGAQEWQRSQHRLCTANCGVSWRTDLDANQLCGPGERLSGIPSLTGCGSSQRHHPILAGHVHRGG